MLRMVASDETTVISPVKGADSEQLVLFRRPRTRNFGIADTEDCSRRTDRRGKEGSADGEGSMATEAACRATDDTQAASITEPLPRCLPHLLHVLQRLWLDLEVDGRWR